MLDLGRALTSTTSLARIAGFRKQSSVAQSLRQAFGAIAVVSRWVPSRFELLCKPALGVRRPAERAASRERITEINSGVHQAHPRIRLQLTEISTIWRSSSRMWMARSDSPQFTLLSPFAALAVSTGCEFVEIIMELQHAENAHSIP